MAGVSFRAEPATHVPAVVCFQPTPSSNIASSVWQQMNFLALQVCCEAGIQQFITAYYCFTTFVRHADACMVKSDQVDTQVRACFLHSMILYVWSEDPDARSQL